MEKTDQVLVDETLAGGLDGYDVLMRRYERLVFKIAQGFGREREASLDITQNTFLKAYRGLSAFQRGSSFKTWLARIAYNEGINWCRSQRRHEKGREELDDGALPGEASPGEDLLRRERQERIRAGMGALQEKHRLALTLRYFEGMPVREVAAILGCTEGTAKSILFRGVRRLRDSLGEPGA